MSPQMIVRRRWIAAPLLALFCAAPVHADQLNPQQLLQDLKQGTATEKCIAADGVTTCEAPSSLFADALLAGLSDKDPEVRWHCARTIGTLGLDDAAIRRQLTALLADENAVVKAQAARTLARLGNPSEETIRGLVKLATDSDARVARVAVASIRQLQVDRKLVVEALVDVLDHEDQSVAMHGVDTMVEMGEQAVPFLQEALANDRAAYWAAIAVEQIGPPAKETLPSLVKLIRSDSDPQLRIQAMLAVASLGEADEPACQALTTVLNDSGSQDVTRAAAAYAIGTTGCTGATDSLRTAAGDDDELLSMVAAWALAKQSPDNPQAMQTAVEKLIAGLKSDKAIIRSAAARGLHKLEAPPELVGPALIAASNDPDPSVFANVIDALASLGPEVLDHAVPALQKPEYREVAIAVLTKLGPEAAPVANDLVSAFNDDTPEFNAELQLALAEIGAATPEVIRRLTQSLSSDQESVRNSAIYALGRLGPKASDATGALQKLVSSSDAFDSTSAAWALAYIHPDDPEVAKLVVPALIRSLGADREIIRFQAADALGKLGAEAKPAVPALKKRLASEESAMVVKQAIAEALEAIGQ
ncbi:hypothetical protein FYK55_23325 [Roseiconus nitratireducens]|uniref:HEAT repeat protein n=1 Tax=Roseiconus nitratireducens TaxID=2605748 RepID=A0A5M6CXB6_9BACT|nr:HEAT repeat domain-containing protein [Roseiconus nitratireducens]KAA5539733.1 hypothetical protein FYK55_23325 [Roseiconus nitratireducens]